MTTAPIPVLVARLEHELETLRLHVLSSAWMGAEDSVKRSQELVASIRENL